MDFVMPYLPPARRMPYEEASAGTGVSAATLYAWASKVASATFEDIAVVEVVMRSRMADALVQRYGMRWYERQELFDDDTLRLVANAWRQGRLTTLRENGADEATLHGKLVASMMFGFWVKLLGRGSYQGKEPFRQRRIYDTLLWSAALRHAFPGVGPGERRHVERLAHRVQAMRNRIAHHEHIIWGVPIDHVGRVPVRQVHASLVQLTTCLEPGTPALAEWLQRHSKVPGLLDAAPLAGPWD